MKKDTSELANSTTKSLQTTLNVSDESMGKFKGDMSYFFGSVKSTLYNTTAHLYNVGDEGYTSVNNSSESSHVPSENTFEVSVFLSRIDRLE